VKGKEQYARFFYKAASKFYYVKPRRRLLLVRVCVSLPCSTILLVSYAFRFPYKGQLQGFEQARRLKIEDFKKQYAPFVCA